MPNVLRARSHEHTDVDSVSGPQSYSSGGFSVRTNVGRVDEFMVQVNNSSYEARATVADNNALVVTAHSQATGNELADDTDLSADEFTYSAHRL